MLYFKLGRKKTDHTVNPQEDDNGWRSVGESESVSVLISGVQAEDFLWLQAGLLAGLIPTTTVFFFPKVLEILIPAANLIDSTLALNYNSEPSYCGRASIRPRSLR